MKWPVGAAMDLCCVSHSLVAKIRIRNSKIMTDFLTLFIFGIQFNSWNFWTHFANILRVSINAAATLRCASDNSLIENNAVAPKWSDSIVFNENGITVRFDAQCKRDLTRKTCLPKHFWRSACRSSGWIHCTWKETIQTVPWVDCPGRTVVDHRTVYPSTALNLPVLQSRTLKAKQTISFYLPSFTLRVNVLQFSRQKMP